MAQILHISAHLGGGIGKALSGLVKQSIKSNSEFKHTIISLEEPIKSQFVDKIRRIGGEVIICPTTDEIEKLMIDSDIVQLEWWNNPILVKYLSSFHKYINIRLLVWCHNNGLFSNNIKDDGKLPPIIPKKLILESQYFIFTNPCSDESKELWESIWGDEGNPDIRDKIGIVYSSGGFEGFPDPKLRNSISIQISEMMFKTFIPKYIPRYPKIPKDISVGYFGTINFSKLHPSFVEFIRQANDEIEHKNVTNKNIKKLSKVKMIGEYNENIRDQLNQQCDKVGESEILQFTGYIPDNKLVSELGSINVIAYILNPKHYGTTENSLLEAMSMGIVPIVLNNPAESYLVDNGKTGFIVHNPKEFGEIILYLSESPDERKKIGMNAANTVRERFSAEKTEAYLNEYYRNLMKIEKKNINFKEILSDMPDMRDGKY